MTLLPDGTFDLDDEGPRRGGAGGSDGPKRGGRGGGAGRGGRGGRQGGGGGADLPEKSFKRQGKDAK